jgi:hypothetical protein
VTKISDRRESSDQNRGSTLKPHGSQRGSRKASTVSTIQDMQYNSHHFSGAETNKNMALADIFMDAEAVVSGFIFTHIISCNGVLRM